MEPDALLECCFLIPERRDSNLTDGSDHPPVVWDWLENELHERFGGLTVAHGTQRGSYVDPDTQERVGDQSFKFTVAVAESRLTELRRLLSAACVFFEQKCIYLSIAGHVEFVAPPE